MKNTGTAAGAADQVFRIPGAGGAPAFGAIDLTKTASLTGFLPVGKGGTGLSSGVAGGIPYFTSASTMMSSAATSNVGDFITNQAGGVPTWTTILPITNGGTGSTIQNFVDLTNNQSISGTKTFSSTISGSINGNAATATLATTANALAASATLTTPNIGAATGTSLMIPLLVGGSTASSALTLKSTSGTGTSDGIIFQVGSNGATEAMRILTGGNVGIGTSSPGQKLSVAGTIESTTGGIKFPDGTIQTTAALTIIYTKCAWVSTGVSTCTPPVCPGGWTNLGTNNMATGGAGGSYGGSQENICSNTTQYNVISTKCAWTSAGVGTCTPPSCPGGWTNLVTNNLATGAGNGNYAGYQENICIK